MFPPAVTIHCISDARLAVGVGRPVALLSGAGAAGYAGCGWWRAIVAGVAAVGVIDILDCGEMSGRAVEALGLGLRRLVLRPEAPGWADVAGRASLLGAVLLPVRPASLDLARPGAARHLHRWLA